ncbi:MAG: phenylalanine--tRNA ligase subunit alpha [Candidatus Omnitrophota bacterium]|nr:phenylalanine--tRNA ligase subunit alpha [Candidatus Omnitrophota bacterium]
MKEYLKEIEKEALGRIGQVSRKQDLENLERKYLGRKGKLSEVIKKIGMLSLSERSLVGQTANRVKEKISRQIQLKKGFLKQLPGRAAKEKIDISLPGVLPDIGHSHPITQIIEQIAGIFSRLGFHLVEGPEIETEYYNFEALNMPVFHPSRETFHTFYTTDNFLLRSQTSTVQIRVMEKRQPPISVIAPGKVFRPDATDASHSFMFHQVEGLMVDKKATFAELKGILTVFLKQMFGSKIKMRFRPHYFPFTEPSAEIDISCIICKGAGCRVCSQKGWLEILGAGLVDPAVFKAVGYNPEEVTGFAFGMGVERIAMLKYGIDDIRLLFENDLRLLEQF